MIGVNKHSTLQFELFCFSVYMDMAQAVRVRPDLNDARTLPSSLWPHSSYNWMRLLHFCDPSAQLFIFCRVDCPPTERGAVKKNFDVLLVALMGSVVYVCAYMFVKRFIFFRWMPGTVGYSRNNSSVEWRTILLREARFRHHADMF